MGRRLPFLPTCGSPSKTLSFRATTSTSTGDLDHMAAAGETVESVIRGLTSDRFFFNPGKTSSILEEAKPKDKDKDEEKDKERENVLPLKESVSMMEMESTDPFVDFKKSMQEMVEADEGLKEWENLQELLSLYLAVNDKINHGYIIGAFVDLMLVNLGSTSSSSCSSSSSSINGQDQSLYMEPGSSNFRNHNKNKKKMSISSESPESFTSSSASSSGTCSSTSHCLSSCSLEEEEEEEDDDDDDDDVDDELGDDDDDEHKSPQKASVSDGASS